MRTSGIIIALACMTLLAGIGAAVDLFGGSEVQFQSGNGGAAGGPYVQYSSADPITLNMGVNALAWATEGAAGKGYAAFDGSGRATAFTKDISNQTGYQQTVYYEGRVAVKVDKTSSTGNASASASVGTATTSTGTTNKGDRSLEGSATISTKIGEDRAGVHNVLQPFNGTGTAQAYADGTAGYSMEYINKTSETARTASIKTAGEVSGNTYLTAENKASLSKTMYNRGSATITTTSKVQNKTSTTTNYTRSSIITELDLTNGATSKNSTIAGFANADYARSKVWTENRTSVPSDSNYNAYSTVSGNVSGSIKTSQVNDTAKTYAGVWANATDILITGEFSADTSMLSYANASRKVNSSTRVEGQTYIDNANAYSQASDKLNGNVLRAESQISTATGGDDVGAAIFLSNYTKKDATHIRAKNGFNATTDYRQSAVWNPTTKKFGLITKFNMNNYGLNYTTSSSDTGAIGVKMNIQRTGRNLNATYGSTLSYTDIANQKNWNWYGATIGSLNQGETFSARNFQPTGQDIINTQTYTNRHYTRQLETSNPV